MPQIINTNIASLNSQRNLNTSQSALATSLQRLSSGLRINSAKDDAAGLAISERFTSQIRGLNQAARNANDGISLAQTAEGALGQMGDALQRIRELAVQSANATNSASDRAALQKEVSQLVAEISRIGETTSFNGLKILDGSYANQQYQVGANVGESISVSIADSRASQLGATTLTSTAGFDASTALSGQTITINGQAITVTGSTMNDVIDAINDKSGDTGVTAARATTNTFTATGAFDGTAATVLTINGTTVNLDAGSTVTQALDKINAVSVQTGVTATENSGVITFSSANGADFTISSDTAATIPGVSAAVTYAAGIELSSRLGSTINVDSTGGLGQALNFNGATQVDLEVANVSIATVDDANKAIATMDAALTQINSTRADLGALQNRFEAVVTNLNTAAENFSASRSRILDTDFAAETANLTRAQILQQAGTAMLAQANALPNNVLALLRG